MSKFFYRGKPDIMGKHNQGTYQPKPKVKPGSEDNPLQLCVPSHQRESEVIAILTANKLFAEITIDSERVENIAPLEVFAKTPQRNDPFLCGSNKKYKKCCG